jgi:hypothetical protein
MSMERPLVQTFGLKVNNLLTFLEEEIPISSYLPFVKQ